MQELQSGQELAPSGVEGTAADHLIWDCPPKGGQQKQLSSYHDHCQTCKYHSITLLLPILHVQVVKTGCVLHQPIQNTRGSQ